MRGHVFARAVRDRRRSMLWWILGTAVFCLVIVASFPAMQGQEELNQILEDYPPELLAVFAGGETTFDLGSAADYLNSQLFALIAPILLVILAVGFAGSTLAGEEESGVLDLVLSQPVSRRRVLLEKAGALAALVAILNTAIYVCTFGFGVFFEVSIPLSLVLQSALGQLLLGVLFGFVALAVGAATGARGPAIAAGAGLAVATYLLGSLAPVVDWLGPTKWLSPFYFATGGNPLANGLPAWHVAVLSGLIALALVAAIVTFERRDLRG